MLAYAHLITDSSVKPQKKKFQLCYKAGNLHPLN